MANKTGRYSSVVVILLTIISVTEQQEINYDIEYMCGQMISVYDNDVVLNGRPSFAPADVPTDCIVELEAGYSDGSYRLQIIIEAIDINNCGVNVAIFNGRGASGNYLRQISCRSMTTDTLYTENKAATIRLHRPINVAQNAYVFTIKTRAYKDDGKTAILRTGANLPDGAIAGIILALLALILFAILLAWCWKSGRISDYINNYRDDDDDFKGQDNFGTEKSETESVTAGTDKNPLVWNTTSSGHYDPKTVPLGRRSFRNARPNNNENGTSRDVTLTAAKNGELSAAWQNSQTDIKQALDREMNQGQGFRGRGPDGDVRGHSSKVKGHDHDRDSKETLEDEVFESDDNKAKDSSRFGEEGGRFTRGEQGRGSGGNRGSGRGDDARGSLRRAEDGSPNRGSLRRGEDIRESGKSTSSNKEEKKMARNLADEAATLQLRPMKTQSQMDPPSDLDSSSFMSVPEVATVTASVHAPKGPVARSPTPPPPPPLIGDNKSSDDSELREINERAEQGTSAEPLPNTSHKEPTHIDSKKSPSSRKKKKKKPKYEEEKDRVPPEAFEPLFPNPVSEDPLPEGMQPLHGGMYGPQAGMYPMQPYGMPYGMMPGMMAPPGMMPPGSQAYSYAYQAAPQPGAPPQQVAGKAAWFVQETPTKDGPVQKTAFMMATESRPDSQQDSHPRSNGPGAPSYSSTPYGETPRRKDSGRRGRSHPSGHPNDSSLVPSGILSPDSGHGHRSTLMKSGVDPNTGIETRQALWTDTTRDPTDPPLNSDTKINRKTVTRTTTRGGYGNLPQHVDNITDHLYISMEPEDPAFLAPSGTGAHAITSTETPERDNAAYYAGLHHSHHASPQRAIHPAPHYHESIRDHISYA